MSLQKIQKEKVFFTINHSINQCSLLNDYNLSKQEIKEYKSPNIVTNYDSYLESNIYDRWLFIRVEDYYKNQRIVIWLNHLNTPHPTNFDLEEYFIKYLGIHSFKQKVIFKANKVEDLENKISEILDFIILNMDARLQNIFLGRDWIDMPFNWEPYK